MARSNTLPSGPGVFLGVLAITVLSASCATALQSYPGDRRAKPELAVVRFQNATNSFARFANLFATAVDGKQLRMKPIDSLELLPGRHVISVECELYFRPFSPNYYSDSLEIEVVAGHSYLVEFRSKQFCLKDTTEDAAITCGDSAKAGSRLLVPPVVVF